MIRPIVYNNKPKSWVGVYERHCIRLWLKTLCSQWLIKVLHKEQQLLFLFRDQIKKKKKNKVYDFH